MVMETIVGWRDTHFPGDVTCDQRTSWDGLPFQASAATLDPKLVAYSQRMLADNQFFFSIARQMEKNNGFRVTFSLLAVPERYETIKARPPSNSRLPMSWDQPDFVFSDEEDGVIAIKNGKEILYASLYWRARHAVNFLGRVHYITPICERIATVKQEIDFTPSGMEYSRPDWTNFGFANGGHRYPASFVSAHTGEKLPIAKIPDGVDFKAGKENIHAGKGNFYQMCYGPYRIALNMSADQIFQLRIPESAGKLTDLVTRRPVKAGSVAKVAPRTTVVIFQE